MSKVYNGDFKGMFRRFANGSKKSYSSGDWSVAVGGYDCWFEVYYKRTPIINCINGELNILNHEIDKNQMKKLIDIIKSEYDGII